MFKSLSKYLSAFAASLLTVIAMSGVSNACTWGLYEPKMPKSLRKEL
ncbi:MAG: cyclic lactone autoinducer peptide [Anaeromicrobium sp.]|jgi:cyclic lactone autoinducer peptide|nr:cyclic lactone autoinducer peptide [Anaeromicrobium sp.]MCT4592823.1 cyclic lactone autoinducer peptide [Anaeromicrobium sp.]